MRLLAFSLLSAAVTSQPPIDSREYLNEPVLKWDVETNHPIMNNNGVFYNNGMIYSIAEDCHITAITKEGTKAWEYDILHASKCAGGLFFASDKILFSVTVDGSNLSQIRGLYLDGELAFTTTPIQGTVAGNPVSTADGKFALQTINDGGVGKFVVFDIAKPNVAIEVEAYYTFESTGPLSPIGYYWNPVQGYYPGGFENSNDVFIFGSDMPPDATTAGFGQTYAFQLPVNNTEANVTMVGEPRGFQSNLPPVLAKGGLSMYWAVTRSEQRCWNGEKGMMRSAFDKGSTGKYLFARGEPRFAAAKAPPTLGTDYLFGPSASAQIFRLPASCPEAENANQLTITTNAVVTSRLVVAPDEQFVYYATPFPDNALYRLTSDLDETWKIALDAGVMGDLAQSPAGDMVYVGDVNGRISGIQVAEVEFAPTTPPTMAPTTKAPTNAPTVSPKPVATGSPVAPAPTVEADAPRETATVASEDAGSTSGSSLPMICALVLVLALV